MRGLLSGGLVSVKQLSVLQMTNTSESRTEVVSDEARQRAALSPDLGEQRAPGQRLPPASLGAPPSPAGTQAGGGCPHTLPTFRPARPAALGRSFPSPGSYEHLSSPISSPSVFEVRSVNWRVSSAAAAVLQGC